MNPICRKCIVLTFICLFVAVFHSSIGVIFLPCLLYLYLLYVDGVEHVCELRKVCFHLFHVANHPPGEALKAEQQVSLLRVQLQGVQGKIEHLEYCKVQIVPRCLEPPGDLK